MGVLSLNVVSSEKGIKKTMQFEPSMLVFDASKLIREKFGMHETDPNEYGLFRIVDDPSKCVWMENGRKLEYYLVRNGDSIEYKKKMRYLKVRMLDGAVKTISVDESQPVSQLMLTICNKIGISNYEEYSLVRDDILNNGNSTWNLREERSRSTERGGMMGTLGRKKEQKLEELRKKLHTDEELPWLDHNKTLREQNISEEETLLLRRKFFFSDTNVDSRDPVQLNLLYVQCRDGILRGLHPVSKETALQLAALQSHIEYGDFPYDNPKFHVDGRDVLPKEYAKNKENEKKVVQLYKELSGTNELDAKSKYVHLCRELKTYGVTFFVVKEKVPGRNRLVPRLLGVNKECVMRVDEKTKAILKEWPLEQIRRYTPSGNTFNLDFGDYLDSYYSVQTPDGEKICQLIAGYIDIILKKKRTRDHQGIEGDEGSTMLEDVVAPARATLVAHGQIGSGQHAVDGSVAVRGVLRTPQGGYGYGINGAQYGAVSGEVTSQSLGRAQRIRVQDMYEHPQRALIGTIEATIRAVDEAEVELEQEPQIDIPKFTDDHAANRWIDEQMAVNKENVNERLAAMGAATAQVVQWTAVQEEYDDRVGTAIATIGSNLPDVSRNVRDLSALMPREERGDLVEATRMLCGAFGDFLTAVNPEQKEKRNVVFTAAGRVGEFSQQVINSMETRTEEQKVFDDHLVQKAKNVATSTAQLVLCAKTISAECEEPELQEKVIQSATKCAFATSQLVACARVVAPTIDNSACQQQLNTAATEVSQSVSNLLHDAEYAVDRQETYSDIHTAARRVTSALDSLLEHAKTSPKTTTHREEEEEYNEVLRRTNKIIAYQGPSEDLTREAKRVIRHSQILTEQFEMEANQRPEDRDRLLDAARRVATATSDMIAATKDCESRPSEVDSERNLRTAAERLSRVTNETTQEQQEKHIMQRLEQAAKQTAYDATQTIAASNAAKDVISNKTYSDSLVYESRRTAEHLPRLIISIRESQNAQSPEQQYNAQSQLIKDSHQILETSTLLVESARRCAPMVSEVHLASNLSESANRLTDSLAALRVAVNDAQKFNSSQQHVYEKSETVHYSSVTQRGPLQLGELIDLPEFGRNVELLINSCTRIESRALTNEELLSETNSATKHAAVIAQICRNASTQCADAEVMKHLVNSASEIGSKTIALVDSIKLFNSRRIPENEDRYSVCSSELRNYVTHFYNSLRGAPSSGDQTAGQVELEKAILNLRHISAQVQRSAMDAYSNANVQPNATVEKQLLQQAQHITNKLEDEVDDLAGQAITQGDRLAHVVQVHVNLTKDLASATCSAASIAIDSNQQTELFDKCRTVVEAEIQMMLACRDSQGNPHAQPHVEEAAGQLKHAIGDVRRTISRVSNDQVALRGMVDTISLSIANTDIETSTQGSIADSQTRMNSYLEEIRRTAQEMPHCNTNDLGPASLNLSEKYRLVASDVRQAVGMLPEAEVGQKLKVAVQKLGTSCIDTVKVAGQRRAHPDDERIYRELIGKTDTVVERVDQVLAALHEASRGTQACINAANTVSGIIGDLDTTIMFATSGSLNMSGDQKFPVHRDAILKTAKALVEDTKALVTGAASNQEQLAVAAQNAVRTIVNLSDAVKNGAVSLHNDNAESQVLVIHAVRDVAAALASLIQATKNASGRSCQHPAMTQLKEAAKVMVSNVTCLLKTVKSVEDRHNQGPRALEAAVEAVNFEIKQYDVEATDGSTFMSGASAEHLQNAAENVSQVTQRIAASAEGVAQEEVIAIANLSRTAVRSLLAVVRTVASEADTAEQRYAILDSGRDVASNVKALLVGLHSQLTRHPNDDTKMLLLEASRGVSRALSNLVGICGDMSNAEPRGQESAAAQAESELLGAASSIEAASIRLAELRPRHSIVQPNGQELGDDDQEFDEKILSAAKSITSAVQTLVRAASNAQRELIAQGRLDTSRSSGPDYQWSEGLVSAARFVVAAVHQLCEAANALVQGQASEEKLISAAKQVASSTAHLLVACNVKADMDSQAKKRLQIAGQAVKTATERLVQSARQIVSRDDRNIVISERLVSGIAQVMDAQEEVLRKEKELGEARNRLAHLNKARYERDGSADQN
ncbi:unnamed protein product [Caenorhabditis bovis]|uniref:FERM domain-containing protein n=1 Tax=Caenorhabditis bovis TaxID=2654633 RepID=A0A8S1EW59_9PELO|nr:unnamed protein product [Caenorhabditis bovis]